MKIGLLVSGGDSPAINAAIYSLYQKASQKGDLVCAIEDGYDGIMEQKFRELKGLQAGTGLSGGSVIRTGRSRAFPDPAYRRQAIEILRKHQFDSLIVIGGNGSLAAGKHLSEEGFPAVGIPATIDGDVLNSEAALGFDTAVQETVHELQALHMTAQAYPGRIFLLEVLGGDNGSITLLSGLAGNADLIVVPEAEHSCEAVAAKTKKKLEQGAESIIIAFCEGAHESWRPGTQHQSIMYGDRIFSETGIRPRYSMGGYGLRGLVPTANDCLLAKEFASLAFEAIRSGRTGVMTCKKKGILCLEKIRLNQRGMDLNAYLKLAEELDVLPVD